MGNRWNVAFLQGATNLRLAANMAGRPAVHVPRPSLSKHGALTTIASALEHRSRRTPPAHTCQQRLTLSFYFDGPGHQRAADAHTDAPSQSNVGKLFAVRRADSVSDSYFSFYIPGLGTPFVDIGDRGEVSATAFLKHGEARLQWATKKVRERIQASSELCGIDVFLFGYSRGAALARAFANRLGVLGRVQPWGVGLSGKEQVVLEVRFMGLWDTVAAMGPEVNLTNERWHGLVASDSVARDYAATSRPPEGNEPTSQMLEWSQTHPAWCGEIAIAPYVVAGVHIIAGHEIANSLPVDTTLIGSRQPPAFHRQEFVFPGRQVDVGGGYRDEPRQDASKSGETLATLALRFMHEKACAAGAPLHDLHSPEVAASIRLLFASSNESDPQVNHKAARSFGAMRRHWDQYLRLIEQSVLPLTQDHALESANRFGTHSLGSWLQAYAAHHFAWWFRNFYSSVPTPETDCMPGEPCVTTVRPPPAYYPLETGVLLPYHEMRQHMLARSYAPDHYSDDDPDNEFLELYLGFNEHTVPDMTLPTDPRVAYVGGKEATEFAFAGETPLPDCGFARPGFNRGLPTGYTAPPPSTHEPNAKLVMGQPRPATEVSGVTARNGFVTRLFIFGAQQIPVSHAPGFERVAPGYRVISLDELAAALTAVPDFLRQSVDRINIHPFHVFGGALAVADPIDGVKHVQIYPIPNYFDKALIHDTITHELGHFAGYRIYGEDDWGPWKKAIATDRNIPSGYAQANFYEDLAEFTVLFVAAVHTACERVLEATYPARYAEFRRVAEHLGFRRAASHPKWSNDRAAASPAQP